MTNVDWVRNLGGLLPRLGSVRWANGTPPDAGLQREPEDCAAINSRALRKFLSCVGTHPAPVLLDLGPVVGSNVTFFGQQLNCKVYIEDLLADLDRHQREGRLEAFPAFLSTRFVLEAGAVDGVLLWDVFDYLDRPSAQALASTLVRLLRAGGPLLGFFGSTGQLPAGVTKFVVANDSHVERHGYASPAVRRNALQNRDIIRMFDGLNVCESFLLQNGLREFLFRKGVAGG